MRAFREGVSVYELQTRCVFPNTIVTYEAGVDQHVIYFAAVLRDLLWGLDRNSVFVFK